MIENTILSGLIYNEEYMRKVLPFLKSEYFHDNNDQIIYKSISEYIDKYNSVPTKESLLLAISEKTNINQQQHDYISQTIKSLDYNPKTDLNWLLDKTEKFCQDKAVYNAVRESILVLDGQHKSMDKGSIPELLSNALGVSFDNNIGHDFLEDNLKRYEFYHTKEDKIPFDIDIFNLITKGGVSRKALIVGLAGTGVGKTLFMCHCAASNLMQGYNVLYITMEMAEERIAERIDANLLDWTLDELRDAPRETYVKRIEKIKSKTTGKLIVKEYPTASAGSGHFRHLINELRLKKNFIPDIIYIDYLNICISSRIKQGGSINSYTYIKAIAEELRGLGVEFNVPIFTATQTTRSGYSNSDVDITDTSESFGLPATADFMFGLVSNEELQQLGQLMVKQLKNRWGDVGYYKRFVVGIDRSKMKLYNLEQSAQEELVDDSPVMDDSSLFEEDKIIQNKSKKKPSFKGFV